MVLQSFMFPPLVPSSHIYLFFLLFFFFLSSSSSISSFFSIATYAIVQKKSPQQGGPLHYSPPLLLLQTRMFKTIRVRMRVMTRGGVNSFPPGGWVSSTGHPKILNSWQLHRWWFQPPPLLLYLQGTNKQRQEEGKGPKGKKKIKTKDNKGGGDL